MLGTPPVNGRGSREQVYPDQTQLAIATLGAKLGTVGCAASPTLYGNRLNMAKGEPSACYAKPLTNLVEATITLARGGSV